nr:MAG TPA: hypothetical protein [Caudoviricetes sp.]
MKYRLQCKNNISHISFHFLRRSVVYSSNSSFVLHTFTVGLFLACLKIS